MDKVSKLKEILNNVVKDIDDLTSHEVVKLSQELDKAIVQEQLKLIKDKVVKLNGTDVKCS